MPDLHGWITQQIGRREEAARRASDDLFHVLGQIEYEDRGVERDEQHIEHHKPPEVLRRCEADRRILARHKIDPDVTYEPACKGCGTYGEQEMSNVDNLNECPELLDLGYAHGLTPEILTTLDQPETPARPERPDIPPPAHLNAIVKLLSARPTSSVPPALRGPNWKATP